MKEKISIQEHAMSAVLESKEALIEDGKLGNYDPLRPNFIMFFRPRWWKNITKLVIFSILVFVFSPKGIFTDLKAGRIKFFFIKLFFLLSISIPFTLIFFCLCFMILLGITLPIIALIFYLFNFF